VDPRRAAGAPRVPRHLPQVAGSSRWSSLRACA
jgi:hypothetical protein